MEPGRTQTRPNRPRDNWSSRTDFSDLGYVHRDSRWFSLVAQQKPLPKTASPYSAAVFSINTLIMTTPSPFQTSTSFLIYLRLCAHGR